MRQRLIVLALVLGLVSVGPVWAGEIMSPTAHQSWFASIWEGVVSFLSGAEKDGDIDPNHEISIPPASANGDIGYGSVASPELEHGPGLEPGGFLEQPDLDPELDHGPAIDPGG